MTLLRNLSFIRVISMKKQQNFSFVIFTLLFLLPFSPCWAGGKKDNGVQTQQQPQTQQQQVFSASSSPPTVYWTGDGGKGIKIAVLEPSGKGLSEAEKWMPSMVQGSITGDFQKYSAMTIIDRQNLEKILGEQKQSLSGNYSDDDYIRIGKLTNTRYILAGSVTKTTSAYMLELAVTDAESGERKASYPPKAVSPFALENLSAIKEATAELLRQLGVQLTSAGLQSLNSAANIAQVKAETALAKGIAAQKQGTVVEALSYFIQAANYDSGLVEAANRMNTLTANISSGNIGEDTRNDIAWRKEWVKRLQETETFFANTIKEPQPFYIVYSTDIQKGKINYQKETIELNVHMGFYPDFTWSDHINGVLTAVNNGLQATGRAQVWELDWPLKAISTPSPFGNQTKNSTSAVVVEILNNEGKSIGRQTVKAPYGFKIKYTRVTPVWQWEGDVSFPAVDANLITDKLIIRIVSIDGIAAENTARQKKISIMPESEWETLLRTNPVVKRNIEAARLRQKGDEFLEQANNSYNKNDYFAYQGKAFAAYTEALRVDPNNADALVGSGRGYYIFKDDTDKAIADFNAALSINPNDTDALEGRSTAYTLNGDIDKAIVDHTVVLRINPNDAHALLLRGNRYSLKGDMDKAIVDFTAALRINPNDTDSLTLRGWAYENKGDKNRAIADFEAALKIDSNNTLARNSLKRVRGW